MSNTALLERPSHLRAVPAPAPARRAVPQPAPAPAPEPAAAAARNANSLPPGTSPRGFALYVGLDEAKAAAAGVSLGVLVDALRRTLADRCQAPRAWSRGGA